MSVAAMADKTAALKGEKKVARRDRPKAAEKVAKREARMDAAKVD